MPIKSLREHKCVNIEATGSLCVEQSEELLESLRKALSGTDRAIDLDLSGVSDADISCLQLICSAHMSASLKGISFSISRVAPELCRTALEAGFTQQNGCPSGLTGSCPLQSPGEAG